MARKKHRKVALFREVDPGRGPFWPTEKPPIQERETNPKGTRHIDKTRQDAMPRDKRPRVIAWAERQAEMQANAG